MPTGQTPQAKIKRGSGPDALAYGDASSANDLIAMLGPQTDEEDLYEPSGPEEEFLFGPTDRPNEPITAGAPFGPGPSVVRGAFTSDEQAVRSVATQISASPGVSPEARAWAKRVQAGE